MFVDTIRAPRTDYARFSQYKARAPRKLLDLYLKEVLNETSHSTFPRSGLALSSSGFIEQRLCRTLGQFLKMHSSPIVHLRFQQRVRDRFDETCGNDGDASEAAHAARNRAKNSFCTKGATGSTATDPILTTLTTFDLLQEKVEENGISFGTSGNLPEDRNVLKDIATNADGVSIGEGTYVVFVGFMLNAHTAGKESVSCQKGTVGFIDIHMSLARTKNADLCKSVAAEIIPHFRTTTWPRIYYAEHYAEIKRHPLRLKGHLFFDGSHRPCGDPNMTNRDPLRRSNWEIHPRVLHRCL